eukprot:UN13397
MLHYVLILEENIRGSYDFFNIFENSYKIIRGYRMLFIKSKKLEKIIWVTIR